MKSLCIYFQIHQPCRLKRKYSFFDIGSDHFYEDEDLNREICRKVSAKCYMPATRLLQRLCDKFRDSFRVSFSVTGTAIEQLQRFSPEVIDALQRLSSTGCVEFLGETYYHSLSFIYSPDEFRTQVQKHIRTVSELFGQQPVTFRNTELIYSDGIASAAGDMGFRNILAEGADQTLQWRSPGFLYSSAGPEKLNLLLKNYRLSDDIAFRFSDKKWKEYPLSPEKYCTWITRTLENSEIVNLFMDFETFGEHQWKETGIFEFFEKFIARIVKRRDIAFITPGQAGDRHMVKAAMSIPEYTSWADSERNLTAWTGNPMQKAAINMIYRIENEVKSNAGNDIIETWRRLQSSDHFYYMSTKWFSDGDVHRYFNYFASPHDAFIAYSNIINDLHETVRKAEKEKKTGAAVVKSAAPASFS